MQIFSGKVEPKQFLKVAQDVSSLLPQAHIIGTTAFMLLSEKEQSGEKVLHYEQQEDFECTTIQ